MDIKDAINQRFVSFIEYLKKEGKIKSYNEFADILEVKRSHFGDVRNRPGKYVTIDMIAKTLLSFDFLNVEWLFSGKGEMLKGKTPSVGYNEVREAAASGYRTLGDREYPESENSQLKKEIEKLRKDNTTLMDALRLAMGGKESSKTA